MEDCLDAYIVGAAMDVMGLETLNGKPSNFPCHLLNFHSDEERYTALNQLAQKIIKKHINLDRGEIINDY